MDAKDFIESGSPRPRSKRAVWGGRREGHDMGLLVDPTEMPLTIYQGATFRQILCLEIWPGLPRRRRRSI
ncbi:MAG: hypothetical protein IPI57_12235 [Candidatus Competibacteraceae bacterium]|nr:hypothetical protein [Candidatus Competibacteraceae bacterium]